MINYILKFLSQDQTNFHILIEKIKLYYGKIRENFFMWTSKSEVQKFILSVEQAGIEYGADGAFFVYLRKNN